MGRRPLEPAANTAPGTAGTQWVWAEPPPQSLQAAGGTQPGTETGWGCKLQLPVEAKLAVAPLTAASEPEPEMTEARRGMGLCPGTRHPALSCQRPVQPSGSVSRQTQAGGQAVPGQLKGRQDSGRGGKAWGPMRDQPWPASWTLPCHSLVPKALVMQSLVGLH